MTDDQARNVQQYEYDSFGNQHDMKNRIKQPYGYTGREHDRETGLRYYRARYYDGEVGRFISEDPIGFAGGDVNLYGYVFNQPTLLTDPSGRDVYDCIRPLDNSLISKLAGALDLGHNYLWLTSENEGYGLAPVGGYTVANISGMKMKAIRGEIKVESSRVGLCSLVTTDPCVEDKISEIIEREMNPNEHPYYLLGGNCYDWVNKVLNEAGL